MNNKTFYIPSGDISIALLESVRQKVKAIVSLLEIENRNANTIGPVSWDFGNPESSLATGRIAVKDSIVIMWNEFGMASTDPLLEDIADNIDHFIEIEKSIYSVLEKAYAEQEAKK